MAQHILRPVIWPAIGLLFMCMFGCKAAETKGDDMPTKRFVEIVRTTPYNDAAAVQELADSIREKSYKRPLAIVELLQSEDPDVRRTASAVLIYLGQVAIPPLLEKLPTAKPRDMVWNLQQAVEFQINSRLRLAQTIEELLEDTRPIPSEDDFSGEEEKEISRRVCDDAYLMLRKLLAYDELEEEQYFNEQAFLDMTDEQRDEEIARFKKTRRFEAFHDFTPSD